MADNGAGEAAVPSDQAANAAQAQRSKEVHLPPLDLSRAPTPAAHEPPDAYGTLPPLAGAATTATLTAPLADTDPESPMKKYPTIQLDDMQKAIAKTHKNTDRMHKRLEREQTGVSSLISSIQEAFAKLNDFAASVDAATNYHAGAALNSEWMQDRMRREASENAKLEKLKRRKRLSNAGLAKPALSEKVFQAKLAEYEGVMQAKKEAKLEELRRNKAEQDARVKSADRPASRVRQSLANIMDQNKDDVEEMDKVVAKSYRRYSMFEEAKGEKDERVQRRLQLELYRQEAIACEQFLLECETSRIAQRYAANMVNIVRSPHKSVGPQQLPQSMEEYARLRESLPNSPFSAVYIFVLGLVVRTSKDFRLGDKMIQMSLHPDCLRNFDDTHISKLLDRYMGTAKEKMREKLMKKVKVRRHTAKLIKLFSTDILLRMFRDQITDPATQPLKQSFSVGYEANGSGVLLQYKNQDKEQYPCLLKCDVPDEQRDHPDESSGGMGPEWLARFKTKYDGSCGHWCVRSWSDIPPPPLEPEEEDTYDAPMATQYTRDAWKVKQSTRLTAVAAPTVGISLRKKKPA